MIRRTLARSAKDNTTQQNHTDRTSRRWPTSGQWGSKLPRTTHTQATGLAMARAWSDDESQLGCPTGSRSRAQSEDHGPTVRDLKFLMQGPSGHRIGIASSALEKAATT